MQIIHGACLTSNKDADNFHVRILRNSENKKTFIRVSFTAFQSNCNLLLSKDENRYNNSAFGRRNSKIWKLQLYSNTFLDIFPSVTGESIIRRKKSYYTSFVHHLETQTSLSSLFRCFGSLGDGELQVMVMERIEKSLGCQIISMHWLGSMHFQGIPILLAHFFEKEKSFVVKQWHQAQHF